ncbi:MAG: hypothetical protein IJ157_07855, partial [Clostridia bacterium]|nr:hypothetical protein [Clostridia bacterium]
GAGALLAHALKAGGRGLLTALPAAAQAVALARYLTLPWEGLPPMLWYGGLALYFGVRLVGAVSGLTALPGLLWPFMLAYAVYTLFALSAKSLREGMGGGRGPSRLMRLRNGAAVAGLAAALLVLTHLPALGRLLRGALRAVFSAALWLMSLFPTRAADGGSGGGGFDLSGLAGEESGPSAFWLVMEKAFYALAALLTVALVCLLLRLAYKALRRLAGHLAAWLRAYAVALNSGYEDTVERLAEPGEAGRAFFRRQRAVKRRVPEVPWDSLTPRQRVRRSYRDYLRRHSDIPPSRTARQQLDDGKLAALYEAARYSSREITPAEAEESRRIDREG